MRRGIRITVDISFYQAVEVFRQDYARKHGIILTFPQATKMLAAKNSFYKAMPLRR